MLVLDLALACRALCTERFNAMLLMGQRHILRQKVAEVHGGMGPSRLQYYCPPAPGFPRSLSHVGQQCMTQL